MNLETFEHGGILFDQRHGAGAVPDVLKIDYFGFVVFMRPSVFLSLCPPRVHAPSFDFSQSSISMGFLDLVGSGDLPRVRTHEGRGRAAWILDTFGDEPVPVAMLLSNGGRASDLSQEDIEVMRNAMISQDRARQTPVEGPLFDRAIWMGQELTWDTVPAPSPF